MTAEGRGGPLRHRERTRARAWALQVHYRWEAGGKSGSLLESLDETLQNRYVAPPRRPYLRRLIRTLDSHLEEVDRELKACLENWRLDRLATIDRGVLRIGATEILFMDDIPPKVSLKEAVRLAERYGSDESSGFVNGVLDALAARCESSS
ncbi:MAG: transcription antitermination factor NusB [Longimicrobiales bacterium]|nr:transcription antitermination factor NusB [Longimicrobiales bacterium]